MRRVDWEQLISRRGEFGMFMFYEIHSCIVVIHHTLHHRPPYTRLVCNRYRQPSSIMTLWFGLFGNH